MIPIARGHKVLHLVSFYGYSGASSHGRLSTRFSQNESALQSCFAYAKSFGDVPFCIGMDYNDRLDHSTVLPQTLNTLSWFDAVALHSSVPLTPIRLPAGVRTPVVGLRVLALCL